MSTGRVQLCVALGAIIVAAFLWSLPVAAESLDLYRGGLPVGQPISAFGGWGSGTTQLGENNQFLRIVTQGYYQGGRLEIDPRSNIDLSQFLRGSADNTYLELEMRIEPRPEDVLQPEYTGRQEEDGGEGGEPPEDGGYYEEGYPQKEVKEIPRVTKLRAVMVTDQGTFGAEGHSAYGAPLQEEGWSRVDIPLSAFSLDKVPEGKLKRLLLFGNGQDAIWVRAIRLFKEDPQDVVIPHCPDDAVVQEGNPIELAARYEGAQRARFYWDFDLSDGLQRDATGEAVRAIFDVPGTYVVTLIAESVGGRAVPRMDHMVVTVTPIPRVGPEAGGYEEEP